MALLPDNTHTVSGEWEDGRKTAQMSEVAWDDIRGHSNPHSHIHYMRVRVISGAAHVSGKLGRHEEEITMENLKRKQISTFGHQPV